jgi:hypothetical protein
MSSAYLMKKVLLVFCVLLIAGLVACSPEVSEYPDYSTPERSVASLKYAASQEDAFGVYDAFSDAFKEEAGVDFELFRRSLEANPSEYSRMANIEIQQTFDDQQVVVVLLTDGDRMFFVAERGLWKIRMIAPSPEGAAI